MEFISLSWDQNIISCFSLHFKDLQHFRTQQSAAGQISLVIRLETGLNVEPGSVRGGKKIFLPETGLR